MTPQFHLRWASLFRSFSRSSGIIAFMVSLSVLVGWIFDIAALKSFNLDPATTMKANTAISFTLVSVSLWLIQMKRANQWTSRIALGCACTVSLIGLLTLIEYSTGWDIGIDQLVFQDHGIAFGISSPGRMSPIAALNFFLIGIALVFLNTKNQKHYRFVQVLIFIIISISFPILIGYFYSIKPLYRIAFYIGIAVHTAILFFILCIGILSLYPNRGLMALLTSVSDGGRLARRLLSATVLILPFLGLLRLLGERQEVYNTEFGLSIQVVFSVVIFVFLIWRSAIALERKGIEYKQTEEQLYEATQRLKFHMENSPLAVVEWNSDYRITRWNFRACGPAAVALGSGDSGAAAAIVGAGGWAVVRVVSLAPRAAWSCGNRRSPTRSTARKAATARTPSALHATRRSPRSSDDVSVRRGAAVSGVGSRVRRCAGVGRDAAGSRATASSGQADTR